MLRVTSASGDNRADVATARRWMTRLSVKWTEAANSKGSASLRLPGHKRSTPDSGAALDIRDGRDSLGCKPMQARE